MPTGTSPKVRPSGGEWGTRPWKQPAVVHKKCQTGTPTPPGECVRPLLQRVVAVVGQHAGRRAVSGEVILMNQIVGVCVLLERQLPRREHGPSAG